MGKTSIWLRVIAATLMMGLLLTSCGAQTTESEKEEPTDDETFTIAISINALDPYNTDLLEEYQRVCDELGYELIYTNAAGDVAKQVSDVESLIVQNPDVIGIQALDSKALGDVATSAYEQGIPVANIFFGLDTPHCTTLGTNEYLRGLYAGELIRDYLDAHPDVVLKAGYMWGSMNMDTSHVLYDATMEGLGKYADDERFEILDEQDSNWSADTSFNITENWMQSFPEMNCIIVQGDQCLVGATNAIKSAGADATQWYMFGQDASTESGALVQEGIIRGTLYNDLGAVAESVIPGLVKTATGEMKPGDELVADVYVKIFEENVDEYIDKFHGG